MNILLFDLPVSDPDNFLVDFFDTLMVTYVNVFHPCALKLFPVLECLSTWLSVCTGKTCLHFCRG